MKFKRTKLAATLVFVSMVSSAYADGHGYGGFDPIPPMPVPDGGIGTLVNLNITSGTFHLNDPQNSFGTVAFGAIGFDLVDAYGSQGALFDFLGIPWNVFTGDGFMMPFGPSGIGPAPGGAVPSGTATATTIAFDASAFSASWNGNDFNQGSSAVTGNYDSTTGVFSATWSLMNSNNAFAGMTSTWTVNGVAAAVPEASTYAMMLAGLGLVGGMTVRRRHITS